MPRDIETLPRHKSDQTITLELITELDRATPKIEAAYEVAREAFVVAARQLVRHGERFAFRTEKLKACDGKHACEAPAVVKIVTIEEITDGIEV